MKNKIEFKKSYSNKLFDYNSNFGDISISFNLPI